MALVIVVVLMVTLAASAMAADSYTISVKDGDTHSYKVFQVLSGTMGEDQTKLASLAWGLDATDDAKAGSVDDFVASLSGKSDAELAALVTGKVTTTGDGRGTVSAGSTLSVAPGYYVLVDVTNPVADNDALSLNLVQIVADLQVTPKKGTTTSDKKVDDKNDSNDSEDAVDWKDSADYDIGDDVPFRLTATIAEDYANYTHGYKLTFHDEQSAGLSFKADTVEVFVDGNKITTGYEVVTTGLTAPETFQIKFANLKDIAAVHAGSVITVTYASTLTGDAVVIGKPGNPNKSHVTYTNNPNDDQGGENGKTPDDKVVVFTYKLDVDKIDANGDPLTGAGFTLYKKNSSDEYEAVGSEVKGTDMTNFLWKGIDDGDYKIVETTTPDGYNTMSDIEFTVSATHSNGDEPELSTLTVNNDKLAAYVDAGTMTKVKTGSEPKVTESGEVTGEIINQSGTTLPSTGGIGTQLFYIGGGLLALIAVVLLVTKRRMTAE